MSKYAKLCREFVSAYLQRSWTPADGLPEKEVRKAELRLSLRLPSALRDFYLSVGAVADLCSIHNTILPPKDLSFEEGYLMFMEENQSVVSWGIKRKDLRKPNPEVWQRNNSFEKWYSEEKGLIQLLTSMFDWYNELGVWSAK
jgi:hypothetical protein